MSAVEKKKNQRAGPKIESPAQLGGGRAGALSQKEKKDERLKRTTRPGEARQNCREAAIKKSLDEHPPARKKGRPPSKKEGHLPRKGGRRLFCNEGRGTITPREVVGKVAAGKKGRADDEAEKG